MKNSILLVAIGLVFSSVGYGQINSGKVTYKLEYQVNVQQYVDSAYAEEGFVKSFNFESMMNKKKSAPYVSYSLVFTPQEAHFEARPGMANDNGLEVESLAKYATIHGGVFYTNLSENMGLNQFNSMGEELLVQTDLDSLQWTIGQETKVIQGYTCRKATAVINMNAVNKGTVIAWFAPELPFQFGPMGLVGLPGMILGLKRNEYYFYADKIKLSPKERVIERPTKGRCMTAYQFYGGIQKMAEEMRKNR